MGCRRLPRFRPSISPDHGTPGNGLLLFFRVDDFDLALQRARSLVTRLEEECAIGSMRLTAGMSRMALDRLSEVLGSDRAGHDDG
jgi:hypothetical protein